MAAPAGHPAFPVRIAPVGGRTGADDLDDAGPPLQPAGQGGPAVMVHADALRGGQAQVQRDLADVFLVGGGGDAGHAKEDRSAGGALQAGSRGCRGHRLVDILLGDRHADVVIVGRAAQANGQDAAIQSCCCCPGACAAAVDAEYERQTWLLSCGWKS